MITFAEYQARCTAIKTHLEGLFYRVHLEFENEQDFTSKCQSIPCQSEELFCRSLILHNSDAIVCAIVAKAFPSTTYQTSTKYIVMSAIMFDFINNDKIAPENIAGFHAKLAETAKPILLDKTGRFKVCLENLSKELGKTEAELEQEVTKMIDSYVTNFTQAKDIAQKNNIIKEMAELYQTIRSLDKFRVLINPSTPQLAK